MSVNTLKFKLVQTLVQTLDLFLNQYLTRVFTDNSCMHMVLQKNYGGGRLIQIASSHSPLLKKMSSWTCNDNDMTSHLKLYTILIIAIRLIRPQCNANCILFFQMTCNQCQSKIPSVSFYANDNDSKLGLQIQSSQILMSSTILKKVQSFKQNSVNEFNPPCGSSTAGSVSNSSLEQLGIGTEVLSIAEVAWAPAYLTAYMHPLLSRHWIPEVHNRMGVLKNHMSSC